jgi:hypothetical protein
MLAAYTGSVDFLVEHRLAVGAENPIIANTQHAEVLHLTNIFRSFAPDRQDVTALLKAMREDKGTAFNLPQKEALSQVASACITSSPEQEVVTDGMHGSKKEQTHMASFSYYTDEHWSLMCSDKTVKYKFNKTSKEWLRWGLRYPSGPTYRLGVATILAASQLTVDGQQAHAMFEEFKDEHKKLRSIYPGIPTLKTFPATVSDFQTMYPDLWTEPNVPVPCRIDVANIRELANPQTIACRSNNAVLAPAG